MPTLGTVIPDFPPLTHVRTLEYYDGELMSELRADDGRTFIASWCDGDDNAHRWHLVAVTAAKINKFLAGETNMLGLIMSPVDGVHRLLDSGGGLPGVVYEINADSIPSDYLPDPTAVYDPSLAPPR